MSVPLNPNVKHFDVIIVGGGPGGSTCGTYLAKAGLSVAIFERESYPRFHIGESLLPATMPIFKETGFYPKLNSGKYIEKFGARFVDYQTDDEVYFGFEGGLNREIPSAFEVERKHFDADILAHAVETGVTLHQPVRVKETIFHDSHVSVVASDGESVSEYTCKFLVDATGRDAFLGKQMKTRKPNFDLNNVAVFAHFTGVKRNPGKHEGDIVIGLLPEKAWTWIIPFKGETTSVGMVCNSSVFKGGADLGQYLMDTLNGSPRVAEYMKGAERTSEVTVISNYSHTTDTMVGPRWIMAGDAAVFLDPIFSSGVHVSCTSGKLASNVILDALKSDSMLDADGRGAKYQEDLLRGVKRFHNLIGMFYEGAFVAQMKKTLTLKNAREGFTSAVAGDMWNEENFLFQKNVL
ncbi:MAG: tryptophan 7-halogenase [Bdellovibrionales bacterium]|nr:tryptophan 7-halogenase [Bdellovibrionales bacterium]